jgi:hypothetical protein
MLDHLRELSRHTWVAPNNIAIICAGLEEKDQASLSCFLTPPAQTITADPPRSWMDSRQTGNDAVAESAHANSPSLESMNAGRPTQRE